MNPFKANIFLTLLAAVALMVSPGHCLPALKTEDVDVVGNTVGSDLAAAGVAPETTKKVKKERTIEGSMKELQARLESNRGEMDRLARFILDWADTSGSSYNGDSGKTGNLFNLNLDAAAISEGIFKPENIAIHVGQNFFNFATSSLAWLIAGGLYSTSNSGRSLFGSNNPDSYSTSDATSSYGAPLTTTTYSSPVDTFSNPSAFFVSSKNDEAARVSQPTNQVVTGLIPPGLHESPFFTSFSPHAQGSYESRKMLMESVSDKEPKQLSIDQLEQLLNDEETGQSNVFDSMTDQQKQEVYNQAKTMVEQKKAIRFEPVVQKKQPTTVRRRRKMLRRPVVQDN